MKKHLLWLAVPILLLALWATVNVLKTPDAPNSPEAVHTEVKSYWTCPMHPQVHSDHPGECPICHMKLIEVKAQDKATENDEQEMATTEGATVEGTAQQLELVGIQRTQVKKMTLKARIPIAGRFISANSVAFQIYESDLRYVKPGVSFTGESSSFSEDDIRGVVTSVDTIIDPTSRTVRAIGLVRKGPDGIIAETSFSGVIEIQLKDRVAIPESAVLHSGRGDLVYVFSDGNKLTAKEVDLGLKAQSFYEVLNGLKPGDVISSGPNFLIDSEAKIRGISDHSHH